MMVRFCWLLLLVFMLHTTNLHGQEGNAGDGSLGMVMPDGEDGVYVFVGETLRLNCSVDSSTGYGAGDLIFILVSDFQDEDEVIAPEYLHAVSGNTLQLARNVSGARDMGQYCCFIQTTSHEYDYVDEQYVYVQEPPRKVQNVSCIVYDWDTSLTCTWDLGVTYLDTTDDPDVKVDVSITVFRNGGLGYSDACPDKTPLKTNCVWNKTYFRAADRYGLIINVTNQRRMDAEPQISALLITTANIIKPAPVVDLHVANKSSQCVELGWNHERRHRDKYYRVIGKAGRGQPSALSDHVYNDSAGESSKFEHCGFDPYTTYSFAVEVHQASPDRGFWSEPRFVTVTTDEAEPETSFPLTPGSYMLHHCRDGRRNVTLLWGSVPPTKRNGEIIGYRLIINGDEEIDRDVPSPMSSLIHNVSCDSLTSVRIFARTRAGASRTNSKISILPDTGQLLDLAVNTSDGKVQAVWNGTSVVSTTPLPVGVMSDEMDTDDGDEVPGHDNVTIFWCRGNIQTKTCQGEVKWATSHVDANTMEIPLSVSDSGNYLFGISTAGRAITWTDCLFQERAPDKEPGGVEVRPGRMSGQLFIQWRTLKCSYSYPVKVAGYRVNVSTAQCSSGADSCPYTSYMVRGADNYSLNIDATPGIQHKVVVQALTATGKLGPPSPPVFGVPQENKEEDNRPIWIITAVASVVLFACVIFIICKVKLCYSNRRAKLDLMRDVKPRPNRRRKREPSPSSPSRQPLDPQTSANTGVTFLSLESGVNGLNRAAGATAENAAWHPQSVASVVLDVDCSIDNGNIPQYPEHSNSRDRQQEDNMDIGAEGLAESRSPWVEAARNPGYLPRFWLPDELKEWQNAPPGFTEEGCNKKDNPVPLQPVKPAAGNDTKYEGKELCVDEQAIPCTVTSPSVMSGNVQEPSAYVRQVPSEGKELCVDEQAIPCTATSPSVMSGNVQEPSAYVRQVPSPSPYVRHQQAVDPYLMVGNGGVVGRDATGTVGHDVTGTVGHDVTSTMGHDVTGTVGRDVTGTVGHGVTDTVGHNVTGTVGHSVTGAVGAYDFIGTVGHYVTGTVGHDVTGTVGHDVTSTMGHDVTGTVGRDVTGTVGHGVTDTVGHNVTGTVGHSVTGAVGAYVTVGYPNADDGDPVGSYVRCENSGGEHHANSDEGSRQPSAAAAHGRNSPSFLGVSRPDNRGSQDGQGETGLSDYLQISK